MSEVCVIIGASHAAAQLSASLRTEGWEGEILVIGDEAYLPYHRPPLSKTFLSGEKTIEQIQIRPAAFYEKQNIQFKLNTRVEAIDREKKSLTLNTGETIQYSKLALCTGSRPRILPLEGSQLPGVHYLRAASDIEGIQSNIASGKKAVIVGGGYIGLETAAVLRTLGLEVTILEMMDRVLQRVTAPEISAFYHRIHTEEGVTIKTGTAIKAIEGNGKVESVILDDQSRLEADLVIIGAGIVPNVELAEKAGLEVDNGILVNELATTSDSDIVAAGDCTNFPNPLFNKRMRLESVPNAMEQSRSAAASICGKEKVYAAQPWFWSDQYDMKLQIAGLSEGYEQVVIRGDYEQGRSFVAWYLKAGKVLAADCVNRGKEFMTAKKLIQSGVTVDASKLADDAIDPKELLQ
ncbi:NAD(P)/FAD-dependent oxidoreductase [Endozoicomonas numazuensis]|uniref:Pyridine nucleotide-disulfide oxidoreductase n=1 Tax=Endozoicomonas numazuensis TaxID=1137799 RepID=A0A081NDL5_9GAMM|nr:FAD/NAD(P)-binding oxidoreductase [Endozoicomonas numazuensis]KEQ16538.1 pyridine nucleotide-disulfide oxidoreductase [Endozoicomonas numazuensis]